MTNDFEKDSLEMEYDIKRNDFKRAGEASSNIKSLLKKIGINNSTVRKVAISTYEAEMNIVIHSFGGTLKAEIDSSQIYIEAKDNGPGIKDISLAMKEGFSTASNEVRELGFGAGMGLPNIKKCTDEFSIESSENGTKLCMIIYIN